MYYILYSFVLKNCWAIRVTLVNITNGNSMYRNIIRVGWKIKKATDKDIATTQFRNIILLIFPSLIRKSFPVTASPRYTCAPGNTLFF